MVFYKRLIVDGCFLQAIDEKMDVKKQAIVPRQFMDLGLASADNEEDLSMDNGGGSMERSICPNNFEGQLINHRNGMNKGSSFRKDTVPFEQGKPQIVREESPEQSSPGWVPHKNPQAVFVEQLWADPRGHHEESSGVDPSSVRGSHGS